MAHEHEGGERRELRVGQKGSAALRPTIRRPGAVRAVCVRPGWGEFCRDQSPRAGRSRRRRPRRRERSRQRARSAQGPHQPPPQRSGPHPHGPQSRPLRARRRDQGQHPQRQGDDRGAQLHQCPRVDRRRQRRAPRRDLHGSRRADPREIPPGREKRMAHPRRIQQGPLADSRRSLPGRETLAPERLCEGQPHALREVLHGP